MIRGDNLTRFKLYTMILLVFIFGPVYNLYISVNMIRVED